MYDVSNPPAPSKPTPAPTAVAPTPGGFVPLDNVLSFKTLLSSERDTIEITLRSTEPVWIAIGVSPNGDMTDDGKGSDVVACSGGIVRRYWVTERQTPENGVVVPGGTCSQENGTALMEFKRSVAATGQQHPIILDGFTKFIWAYGAGTPVFTNAAHQNKGALAYDVTSGQQGTVKMSPSALLWMHMLGMLGAWGALLPFGVTFARYMRKERNGKLWFPVHRACQYIGWACQFIGFIMAVVYVSKNGGQHFSGNYMYHEVIGLIVVILGTLQPINACFRPHPHPDIDPTRGCNDPRICWEFLHKTCGYVAITLGAFNVFLGAYVGRSSSYINGFWLIPLIVAGVCVGSILVFALQKEILGKGKEDPRPVAGKTSELGNDLKASLIP